MFDKDFFTEYGEASQYEITDVVGRGSYGVVASAIDTHTGEKVAIKKMTNIFEHTPDAIRILREIKLLRLLRHPDIVQIKHIMSGGFSTTILGIRIYEYGTPCFLS
ncbi:hypothetical protein ERO13_A01G151454v2 [Gossypium hirsutum]|uniref:mitogen-activated protein kinase n=1 Tax=Gossypium barbadense TaxID=3634 RepID=A0A5J5WXR9_GOSBA|nr:hypothetical protein ES319_A01G155100v1 [Gossypium barbadense]KAG4214917.1 hypothetical protein ERO13_A01G151454v2 [Gossypium hirsutum]